MTFENNLEKNTSESAHGRASKFFEFFSKDTVSKNALFLVSTWFMNAAVGFIFILIAAKMYSIDAVGIAMLLIAYSNIVVLVSRFGIEQSMIRYFNENEKSLIFCSTILATTIPAIVMGGILVIFSFFGFLGHDILSAFAVIFILGVCLLSVSEVCGIFFLADGKPILYLVQSIVIASRLGFLIFLVTFGVLGIFTSLIVAIFLSVVFSLPLIYYLGARTFVIGKKFLADSFHFSLGNYISDFFMNAPVYILPIMVFFLFGETETAIYSVGYAIASIAFLIPTAMGYASFISGCRGDPGMVSIRKKIIPVLILLIGIILVFFFRGKEILSILGPEYSGTANLVFIIMVASTFALFFQIYAAEFKVKKQLKTLICLNGTFFLAIIMMSYIFMLVFGLIGAGYSWIAAYALSVISILFYRKKPFSE